MVFFSKDLTKEQETSLAKERLKYLTQAKSLVNQELMISSTLYKQGALSQMEFIKVSQQANKLNGEFSEAKLTCEKVTAKFKRS